MGVRITPENRQSVHSSSLFRMRATSAESNVLNIAASLGCECLALTKFIEGSPISLLIQSELRSRNIRYEGVSVPQGGPWGYRHQFNIADSGFGLRGPRVWNDRAGEVGRTLSIEEFDLARIFGEEGVAILHLSGLVVALSSKTAVFCAELARQAKRYGARVAFDLNYRASFWKGREAELHETFQNIASLADILVGNEEDFQLALGISGPEAGGGGTPRQDRRIQRNDRRGPQSVSECGILRDYAARGGECKRASLGGRFSRQTASGLWRSRARCRCLTASAAGTALPAGCFTASTVDGTHRGACSLAGQPARWR